MIEQEHKTKGPSLLEEISERRRIARSREQAQRMLPDFRVRLAELIAAKVPPPEEITRKGMEYSSMLSDSFGRERDFDTKLTAKIPLEDKEATIIISTTGHYGRWIKYQVDVSELDYLLIIDLEKARLQSKEWRSEPFTTHTPIGVPQARWPSWSHEVMAEELQAYEDLLDFLDSEGVTFEGSTPPIVKRTL